MYAQNEGLNQGHLNEISTAPPRSLLLPRTLPPICVLDAAFATDRRSRPAFQTLASSAREYVQMGAKISTKRASRRTEMVSQVRPNCIHLQFEFRSTFWVMLCALFSLFMVYVVHRRWAMVRRPNARTVKQIWFRRARAIVSCGYHDDAV